MIVVALILSIFLVALDMTIVATAVDTTARHRRDFMCAPPRHINRPARTPVGPYAHPRSPYD